ncbi:MAG: TRAP transporter substrate-binding protein DctP [Rhodobacteraceae bacterium]|jgi:TRAP-type C4-dicarboxylate transport system substrate-binding protein|nr:TRAP transporter substrate-binding protein DctP [Paracoccaceae bacterium]
MTVTKHLGARIGVFAALLLGASGAGAQTFIFSEPEPTTHFASSEMDMVFMRCVEERSAGQIGFNYFPGGQIASYQQSYDSIRSGVMDIVLFSVGLVSSELPLQSVTTLPGTSGTPTESLQAYRTVRSETTALDDELAAVGLKALMYNPYPLSQILLNRDAPQSLAEMQGIKVRIAGGAFFPLYTHMGALPIQMPPGDIYMALQQNTLDAATLPITGVTSYQLDDVLRSVSLNADLAQTAGLVVMRLDRWNELDATGQETFAACAAQAEDNVARFLEAEVARTVERLRQNDVEAFEFSAADLETLDGYKEAAALEFLERIKERAPDAQAVYDALRAALPE